MVLNVEQATLAFKEKLNQQPEYQKILRQFDAFFEHENTYINKLNALKETLESNHLKALSELNSSYVSMNQEAQDELIQLKKTNKNNQIDAQKQYKLQLKTIEETYLLEKEKLELAIDQENIHYQTVLKKEQNDLHKTLSATKKAIETIKRSYETRVHKIETSYTHQKNELILNNQDQKNDILKHLNDLEETFQREQQIKLDLKTSAATSHDEDYILIKKYYNELTKHLNTQINALKKYVSKTKTEIKNYFDEKKKPIELEIESQEKKKDESILSIHQSLENKLEALDLEFKQFDEAYQVKKRKLMTQTSESVSTLNSKLSNFRELTSHKKQNIIKTLHKQEKESKRIEVSQKNKQLQLLDDELNQLILRTKKLIKEKKIEGQLLLFSHEKEYHQRLAKHTYNRKRAHMEHDLDIKLVHLSLTQHKRHIHDRLSRIDIEANALIDVLTIHENQEMNKYETQVTIASETQERDLSQLTQDVFIDVAYLDIDIQKHDFEFEKERLLINHQLEILQLKEHNDLELLSLKQKRELEKESLIRDLKFEEQLLRENLASNIFERKQKEIEAHHYNTIDTFTHDLDKLETAFSYDLRHAKYKLNHFVSNAQHNVEKQEVITNQRIREQSFDRSLNIMKESLEYFANTTKHAFKGLFSNMTQIQQLHTMLNDFYHTPAHPDALRSFFIFYAAIMTHYQDIHQRQFDEYQKQLTQMYQHYIKDLMDTVRIARYKDFDDEKMYVLEENNIKMNHIEETLLSLQSSMKTLSTQSREFKTLEKEYHQKIKQKQSLTLLHKKIAQSFEHKKIAYDKSLTSMTRVHTRYLKKLQQTMHTSTQTIAQFFDAQQTIIKSMQTSLYMSDSILTSSLKHAKQTEKVYIQKLNFHQQQVFETLMLHYELLHTILHAEKSLKASDKEQDVQTLQSKNDVLNEKHNQMTTFERRQFRKQLVSNKQHLETKTKQRLHEMELSHLTLSKNITKQEINLQEIDNKIETSLNYHDINTNDTIKQNTNAHQMRLSELMTKQHQRLDNDLKTHQQSIHSLESSITTTEQNIESRLVKYRLFVFKKRELLKTQTQNYENNLTKHDRAIKHKRIQAKRKTKKLLQSIKDEKRRYTQMKNLSERRLKKSYEQRLLYMQKQVTRSHKFKMRMMNFN